MSLRRSANYRRINFIEFARLFLAELEFQLFQWKRWERWESGGTYKFWANLIKHFCSKIYTPGADPIKLFTAEIVTNIFVLLATL